MLTNPCASYNGGIRPDSKCNPMRFIEIRAIKKETGVLYKIHPRIISSSPMEHMKYQLSNQSGFNDPQTMRIPLTHKHSFLICPSEKAAVINKGK